MATAKGEGAVPDLLRMDQPVGSDAANAEKTGNWHGGRPRQSSRHAKGQRRPDGAHQDAGDGSGGAHHAHRPSLTVQHFAVPPVVESAAWKLEIVGDVSEPLTLSFDQL